MLKKPRPAELLQAYADDAVIAYDNSDGYNNANVSALQVPEDFAQVRWSKTLMDYLKGANDPRVSVIAEVPQPGAANNANESLDGRSYRFKTNWYA